MSRDANAPRTSRGDAAAADTNGQVSTYAKNSIPAAAPQERSRVLPEIDGGTPPAHTAPAALPGGVHWRDVPGGLNIGTGWKAAHVGERRGRARRLRRSAERAARKGGQR